MEIELTIAKLTVALKSLETISKIDLPAVAGFKLARLATKIEPVVKEYEKTNEILIKEKYGVLSEDGNTYSIPKGNMELYVKEINDLLSTKETINFDLININDFGDTKLSIDVLVGLESFISE